MALIEGSLNVYGGCASEVVGAKAFLVTRVTKGAAIKGTCTAALRCDGQGLGP